MGSIPDNQALRRFGFRDAIEWRWRIPSVKVRLLEAASRTRSILQ
jgi:hypothetical protein